MEYNEKERLLITAIRETNTAPENVLIELRDKYVRLCQIIKDKDTELFNYCNQKLEVLNKMVQRLI